MEMSTTETTKNTGSAPERFSTSKTFSATASRAPHLPTAFARNMLAANRVMDPHGTSPVNPSTLITPTLGRKRTRERARLTIPEFQGCIPSVIQSSRAMAKKAATIF